MSTGAKAIGVGFLGLAPGLPETVRTNDFWAQAFHDGHGSRAKDDITTSADQAAVESPDLVDPEVVAHAARFSRDVFRGTRERRVIADNQEPSDLEVLAARAALADAGVSAEEIDLLIVYSVLQDVAAPLNHGLVAHKLGLRREATAFSLVSGCASFITHASVAARLVQSGEYRRALIVQSAVISRITDYSAPSSVNGGDGAMAAVIGPVDSKLGYIASYQETLGQYHGGIRVVPASSPGTPWYRGDLHREGLTAQAVDAEANLAMGARAVSFCRRSCERVLHGAGYEVGDVDFFVVSQPTAWFGAACCDALGIDRSRTLNTFADYAHLMGASAPINLWTAYQQQRIKQDDLVLVYSPGVGFIQAALLYRWNL